MSNPFCVESVGARWPDNSNIKSVGWSSTGLPSYQASNALGKGANLYIANPWVQRTVGAVNPLDAVTYPDFQTLFNPPSEIVKWRTVSWGIRVSCVAPPLTLSGTLRVRLFSPNSLSTLSTTSLTSILADSSMDIPLHRLLDKDLFIIPMPLGTEARLFNTPDTAGVMAGMKSYGWQVVQIGVDGAPPEVSLLNITTYYNFEFTFADGSTYTAFAQPPPPDNPVVRDANAGVLTKVGNFVQGSLNGIDGNFVAQAGRFIGNAVAAYINPSRAVAQLANNFAQARIVDVD